MSFKALRKHTDSNLCKIFEQTRGSSEYDLKILINHRAVTDQQHILRTFHKTIGCYSLNVYVSVSSNGVCTLSPWILPQSVISLSFTVSFQVNLKYRTLNWSCGFSTLNTGTYIFIDYYVLSYHHHCHYHILYISTSSFTFSFPCSSFSLWWFLLK